MHQRSECLVRTSLSRDRPPARPPSAARRQAALLDLDLDLDLERDQDLD